MGRGWLSKIELLPDECAPIVAWAADQLQARDRTQTEIYAEFVEKLTALQAEYRGELEFAIPSFTAFNRYSIKLATLTQRLSETREIASTLAEKFDAKASDNLTVIAAEAIKTLVFELLTNAGEAGHDPKGAMQMAAALKAATQAQGISTGRRQKIQDEFKAQADQVIDAVSSKVDAARKPEGQEVLRKIREDIYGIFDT